MMPRWAFGLWQCRERYRTAAESIDVLDGYRKRGIPVDIIVQDWQYWRPGEWGSHAFDPARFPDPAALGGRPPRPPRAPHDLGVAEVLSRHRQLQGARGGRRPLPAEPGRGQAGLGRNVFTFYDAFNPAARALYWSQIHDALFTKKVDAWWLDASEPDIVEGPFPTLAAQVEAYQTHMNPTALGSGARMLNAYSLVNSQAVYEGQRAAAPDQRVFILTRTASPAAALRRRVLVGRHHLDLDGAAQADPGRPRRSRVSGMPYWTLDMRRLLRARALRARAAAAGRRSTNGASSTRAGSSSRRSCPSCACTARRPSARCGSSAATRSPAYQAMLKFDRLRYRLLPYVYSLAGAVTQRGRHDHAAAGHGLPRRRHGPPSIDEYMFGPALLVSPVTTLQGAQPRGLPARDAGRLVRLLDRRAARRRRQRHRVAAPFDAIPVHVRARLRSSRSAPSCSTPTRSRPTRSRSTSTPAPTARSPSTRTTASPTATRRARSRRSRFAGSDATRTLTIGKRAGLLPRHARAAHLPDRSWSAPAPRSPFPFAPKPDKTVTYGGRRRWSLLKPLRA